MLSTAHHRASIKAEAASPILILWGSIHQPSPSCQEVAAATQTATPIEMASMTSKAAHKKTICNNETLMQDQPAFPDRTKKKTDCGICVNKDNADCATSLTSLLSQRLQLLTDPQVEFESPASTLNKLPLPQQNLLQWPPEVVLLQGGKQGSSAEVSQELQNYSFTVARGIVHSSSTQ